MAAKTYLGSEMGGDEFIFICTTVNKIKTGTPVLMSEMTKALVLVLEDLLHRENARNKPSILIPSNE